MRMIEANLFPVIPHLHVDPRNRKDVSMSDHVHSGPSAKISTASATMESRLIFGVCYVLFLLRAVAIRLMPWRAHGYSQTFAGRCSIFREASNAASVMVGSSFIGF
ncbi:hypothetical protein [Bradyrhizobium sp.]|uniref:hypothetical protein n=1 Tax=Bradyrhizobium sp. TaxID=376 RepID=UPI003C4B25EE